MGLASNLPMGHLEIIDRDFVLNEKLPRIRYAVARSIVERRGEIKNTPDHAASADSAASSTAALLSHFADHPARLPTGTRDFQS